VTDAAAEAAARAALERVLGGGPKARSARLAPLAGGTHRRSWLATFADGSRAVLRTPLSYSNALLDVAAEARAMAAAAAAGIAPAVLAVDRDRGVLLTEYRPGSRWSAADVHRAANIGRLAALLRTLHALPAELPVFAAERIAARYVAAVPRDASEPRAAEWGDELIALARRYDERCAPTAFCHNDLAAANVLDDGALALVDFEYAVRAAPVLDLANLAGVNGFDGAERRALLEAYRRAEPTTPELEELRWLVRMVELMAWFWALLGAAGTGDRPLYESYLTQFAAQLRRPQ
jgi:thiamine kinase-like enzyme